MLSSGDVGEMIAAVLLSMSANQRKSARQLKDAALKSELASEEKKIDSMEKEATAKLIGGVAAGGLTIGAGACQVVSGAVKSNTASKIWQGSATGAEASGKVTESITGYVAAGHAKDTARAEFAMKQANRNVETASDDDKDARDTARKAIDLLKEWQTAKEDASKAALFRA